MEAVEACPTNLAFLVKLGVKLQRCGPTLWADTLHAAFMRLFVDERAHDPVTLAAKTGLFIGRDYCVTLLVALYDLVH